jgi:poly-D-alanine transfer protein DltD
MKLTKLFYDTLAYNGWVRVDEQINNFVKKNDYKIVDVKYQKDSHDTNFALLIYEV